MRTKSIRTAATRRQYSAYRGACPGGSNGMPHLEQNADPASDSPWQLGQSVDGRGPTDADPPGAEPWTVFGSNGTIETIESTVPVCNEFAGVDSMDQAAVAARAGEGTPPASDDAEAVAGTVINWSQAGHLARALARSSDVVSSLPQCGQLNSIATLRFRWSPLP